MVSVTASRAVKSPYLLSSSYQSTSHFLSIQPLIQHVSEYSQSIYTMPRSSLNLRDTLPEKKKKRQVNPLHSEVHM